MQTFTYGNFKPLFIRKKKEELENFTYTRLRNYYRVLQATLRKAIHYDYPFDDYREGSWKSEEEHNWWEHEHEYVMFVKAIMKSKENI
jgi:hypothetical protein